MGPTANLLAAHRIWLGRDAEMATLTAAIEDLRSGRGGIVLVAGEPGVGKSRLADEACRTVTGVTVHWGRAWEAGGAPAYWLFSHVLGAMCGGLDDSAVHAIASKGHGPLLAGLLPELRARIPGLSLAPTQAYERFELFCAVDAFLRAATARGPHVLVLDDLHATDLSSLLMLEFLVRGLRSHALLIIGTYREIEAQLSAEIGDALARIARDAIALLPLRRFDRGEVAGFLAQATCSDPDPGYVDAMYRRSEGNPLFLRELLRFEGSTHLPAGIRAVVRARLDLLSSPVRTLLEAAAILGREPSLPLTAGIVGLSEGETRRQLAAAALAGIMETIESGWRFTHVLLRDVLYQDTSEDRRAALHQRAADELTRRGGDAALAEVAHHLIRARPIAPLPSVVEAVHAAAGRALELLAFEDARSLYAQSCSMLEVSPDHPLMFDALLGLGLSLIRTANIDLGKQTCFRAAALADRLGDPERLANALLVSTYELIPGMRDEALIGQLEKTLAMLPAGDSLLRARCMAQLAAERQAEPDLRPVAQLAHEAIAMARRTGDDAGLYRTMSSAALAMIHHVDPTERMALNLEVLRLAQIAGDKRVVLRAHLFLINDFWELGDPTGAAAHLHAFATLAREALPERFRWVLATFEGTAARSEGRFDDAARAIAEAELVLVADEARGASMAAARVLVCCTSERFEQLAELESRTRRDFGALGHAMASCLGEILIAFLYGRAGDRRRAAAQLAVVRGHPVFSKIEEPTWLAPLAAPVHLVGDTELAGRLYPVLEPRANRFFTLGPLGYGCDPPYTHQLGLLAETLGRLDDAVAAHEAAEAGVIEAGMRGHLARARYHLACALERRGNSGDRERATVLFGQATALAVELGQSGLVARLATRGAAPSIATPAGPGGPLTLQRENDHWRISWQNRSHLVRDSRGMQVLAHLVEHPDQEHHVLQLMSGDDDGGIGDSGALLDSAAVHQYRDRLLDLREQLEAAERFADSGRASRLGEEIEFLTRELARAVGLGGRARRAASGIERARIAVQKRLRTAIQRIEDADAATGQHLHQTIRTGTFCMYQPDGIRRGRRSSEKSP